MAVETEAVGANGSTLSYKISPATVFSPLAQLIEMTAPSVSIAPVDTTKLSSSWKSAVPSIPDGGDVTLSMYMVYGDASVVALAGLLAAPDVIAWELMATDGSTPTTGSTQTFSGFVTGFAPKGYSIDGTAIVDVTIKVTGAVGYTVGS